MALRIDLKSEDLSISVDTAIRNINAGEVIVAPSEFGYIYLCDAFKKDAVKALHILRGDAEGVAAQVFIRNTSVLTGLVKSFSNDIEAITEKFWPGPLSITFNSQPGLSWNLGDDGRLGTLNIRIPNHKFLNEIHPFADGNGRVCRIIIGAILMQNNCPPIFPKIIETENQINYISTIVECEELKSDGPLVKLLANGMTEYMIERIDSH